MSEKMAKVLYVDDEEINLINFRESLCDEFEIFTALSGEEALALLEKEGEMALVVTDQRMPGIKGTDLL
ncbi:MAG: response regulator, partial [Desulfocapsaceae bacterium]|nr:response regulator [Desulfocapsaceae bacterium]